MSVLYLHKGATIDDVQRVIHETRSKYEGNYGMVEIASYNSVSFLNAECGRLAWPDAKSVFSLCNWYCPDHERAFFERAIN